MNLMRLIPMIRKNQRRFIVDCARTLEHSVRIGLILSNVGLNKTRMVGVGFANYCCGVSRVLKFVFILIHRIDDPKLARDILVDIIHNQCRNLARAANDAK